MAPKIVSHDDPRLQELLQGLSDLAPGLKLAQSDVREQLDLCAQYGVFEWFVSSRWGGQQWGDADIIRGYLQLSAACLTTTFVITQFTGACRRLEACDNEFLQARYLPSLVAGDCFGTLGISHLTTSRRHLSRPVLRAEPTPDGFRFDGFSPWVTGAPFADMIVIGATLEDGQQLLAALPMDHPGVSVPASAELVGLTASRTGPVHCERVELTHDWVIAGPDKNVMKQGLGAKTGGLQTTTLALGVTQAAVELLQSEAVQREELQSAADSFQQEQAQLVSQLVQAADDKPVCSNEELRTRANSLVLRATQAALAAAKGTGYVVGHPAGRWCCEALFFLVWSCPQQVMAANLCELAGISD